MSLKINPYKIIRKAFSLLNTIIPKFERVVIEGYPNTESSVVKIANEIDLNYDIPVFFVVNKHLKDDPAYLLAPDINIIYRPGLSFLYYYLTSNYIFFSHGSFLDYFSKNQIVTNIWHGVFYKPVGNVNGYDGIPADVTIGTSKLTQKMFSEAFDVPIDSVIDTGYPRNDFLIEENTKQDGITSKITDRLSSFEEIIVWLPTYRKSVWGDIREDGTEVGNPFYIENFDVQYFNDLLKKQNALCIVKPHPMAPKYDLNYDLENMLFVDDAWIAKQGLTLYQLVGYSSMLISDVSSIMIDYLLMDQPIICVSTDFEEYRNTRGFYFKDIENWIPSAVLKNQEDFFNYLEMLLITDNDPHKEKREELKKIFFTHHDAHSAERLINYVFSEQGKHLNFF